MMRPDTLAELVALVQDAAARATPLRLVSGGTWLTGGHPVDANAERVKLDAFDGIIEYEPGDLTITVGAATTIAELDAVTARHGQWCPLAPWGANAGTVGATIATATPGPYANALGYPRDLVLGLECVDGTGRVLRPGGKVVKNVAGFDLTRLMTGAWGSLGAITRVSLRLRALPAARERWTLRVPATRSDDVVRALRHSVTPPIAVELSPTSDAPEMHEWIVELAGNAGFVASSRRALAQHGELTEQPGDVMSVVRENGRAAVATRPRTPAERALDARVKGAFDPANILNPGIMG